MKQIECTNSLIASLNHLLIGDRVYMESGFVECCKREDGCRGCAIVGSGRCKDVGCFKPDRVYKFIPKDNLGNLQGMDKETDLIDKMNISYKRERFAFLSLIFAIGALGAIIMMTIIDLLRYAIILGVK